MNNEKLNEVTDLLQDLKKYFVKHQQYEMADRVRKVEKVIDPTKKRKFALDIVERVILSEYYSGKPLNFIAKEVGIPFNQILKIYKEAIAFEYKRIFVGIENEIPETK